jgi:hypothetical protein
MRDALNQCGFESLFDSTFGVKISIKRLKKACCSLHLLIGIIFALCVLGDGVIMSGTSPLTFDTHGTKKSVKTQE